MDYKNESELQKRMNTPIIIEKIQKLLALSESCNEHESHVAMLKAQELLAKHKLSMQEVKDHKPVNSAIKEERTVVSFSKGKWKASLARLVGENFGCRIYFRTHKSHTIYFFGREEDVAVCKLVLEYAIDSIVSAVRRLRYSYQKNGQGTSGVESDYALGFIAGLKQKYEEQKAKNQEWGLVLVADKEVQEAYSLIKFRRSVDTKTHYSGHSLAYEKGEIDGSKFSISDRITEGEQDLLALARGVGQAV